MNKIAKKLRNNIVSFEESLKDLPDGTVFFNDTDNCPVTNTFADGISSDEIKNQLRENTEFAINKGAFGVPTFYSDDEMFWGIDSMKFLVEYLESN